MSLPNAPITPIPENEPDAVPPLWNERYAEIDENFTAVDERIMTLEEEVAAMSDDGTMDARVSAVELGLSGTSGTLDTHLLQPDPHAATAAATAGRLILRDAQGRAKVAAPAEADDIARKGTVDLHANAAAPHSGHETPTGAQSKVDIHAAVAAPHSGHETPNGAQTKVNTHRDVAAPHSGHETPTGAQSKVDTHRDVAAPHSGHVTTVNSEASTATEGTGYPYIVVTRVGATVTLRVHSYYTNPAPP